MCPLFFLRYSPPNQNTITVKWVYFLRHAKSSWEQPELDDIDRPLNPRGEEAAQLMAQLFKRRELPLDHILCSPAERCQQTALHFCQALNRPAGDIEISYRLYEAELPQVYQRLRELPNHINKVLVVGHNTSATNWVNAFKPTPIDNQPTAGLSLTIFSINDWQLLDRSNGEFAFWDYPKLYKKKYRQLDLDLQPPLEEK